MPSRTNRGCVKQLDTVCVTGFFMRPLENNEHNFAALTNIVYCNQKLYNWQDHDHFIALLEQAHRVYDQLLHPFHAAAYPVSGERFKVRQRPFRFLPVRPASHGRTRLRTGSRGFICIEHSCSGAPKVSSEPPRSERHGQFCTNQVIMMSQGACEHHLARTVELSFVPQARVHLHRPAAQSNTGSAARNDEEAQQARLRGVLSRA